MVSEPISAPKPEPAPVTKPSTPFTVPVPSSAPTGKTLATEAKIKEIFESVQGEGSIVGFKQLFIRFCGCNLRCKYCDTDFLKSKSEEYTPATLLKKVNSTI